MAQSDDPKSEPRTTARLKDDIDSGRTEDKVAFFDPAASPLGTDDEAAGTTPSAERIAVAEETEADPIRYSDPQQKGGWSVYLLIGIAIALGAIVAIGLFG